MKILQQYNESGQPVVLGTTIFGQGTLKQKTRKESIHLNTSTETVSMICKPIESANQLCNLNEVLGSLVGKDPQRSTGKHHHTGKMNTSCSTELRSSGSIRSCCRVKPFARTARRTEEGKSIHDSTNGRRGTRRAQ